MRADRRKAAEQGSLVYLQRVALYAHAGRRSGRSATGIETGSAPNEQSEIYRHLRSVSMRIRDADSEEGMDGQGEAEVADG